MSEKDTVQKTMTKYDKKVQKRKEEELKEKQKRKLYMIVGIVIAIACVVGIVSIPVRKYMAINTTYVTIGGEPVTQVEFDYYYHASVNDYVNQYGSYLSYLGLDTTKDFASQPYDENLSWKDYFEQNAVNTITKTKALISEAAANGFTYDAAKDMDKHAENLKEAAAEAGVSVKSFYKATYGTYATASNVEKYLADALLASAYYETVADSKAASEEEVTAYYNDNKANYDSVDYKYIEVAAQFEEKAATNADGTAAEKAEPTEEETTAAMAAAKKEAEEKLKVVAKEGELKENLTKSTISSMYSEWLFDDTRKAGDTTVVEDTAANKYYVLAFEKRYLDETPTSTIRVIMTTEDKGAAVLDEWKAGGATEDAFIALVEKYSEDEFTNTSEGLYEGLTSAGMGEELGSWIFEAGRKTGDTTAITLADGFTYVMYYVGEGKPQWRFSIASTLLTEVMQQYLTEIKAPFEVSDSKGNLKYLTAGTTESTEEGTTTESTEETAPAETSAQPAG